MSAPCIYILVLIYIRYITGFKALQLLFLYINIDIHKAYYVQNSTTAQFNVRKISLFIAYNFFCSCKTRYEIHRWIFFAANVEFVESLNMFRSYQWNKIYLNTFLCTLLYVYVYIIHKYSHILYTYMHAFQTLFKTEKNYNVGSL